MAANKKYDKNTLKEDGEEGSQGESGQSGQVEFRDFLASDQHLRDDLLSPEEKRRLLSVHDKHTEGLIKKQKAKRDEYKALKEGKLPLQTYRDGLAQGRDNSQYKINPVLANKAQFSGIDRQVNALPNENVAETNNEKKEELKYRLELSNRLENAPRFMPPKPSPYNR